MKLYRITNVTKTLLIETRARVKELSHFVSQQSVDHVECLVNSRVQVYPVTNEQG